MMSKWRFVRKRTGNIKGMRKKREEDRRKGLISNFGEEDGMA
jgi:hypothetical protein